MNVIIRRAIENDIGGIIKLFVADKLGGHGDDTSLDVRHHYEDAFQIISHDLNSILLVGELEGKVVATAQVTILIGMSGLGARRARISGVEVAEHLRSKGIGEKMMQVCGQFIASKGVKHVFLASNKNRPRAHSFYERLGFKRSHEGFTLKL